MYMIQRRTNDPFMRDVLVDYLARREDLVVLSEHTISDVPYSSDDVDKARWNYYCSDRWADTISSVADVAKTSVIRRVAPKEPFSIDRDLPRRMQEFMMSLVPSSLEPTHVSDFRDVDRELYMGSLVFEDGNYLLDQRTWFSDRVDVVAPWPSVELAQKHPIDEVFAQIKLPGFYTARMRRFLEDTLDIFGIDTSETQQQPKPL